MEKSILDMIGGEKYIKPHYDIKAESTSCHKLKGFTGIEVNGVRFSNLGEMLCYMNKQKEQLAKAKCIIQNLLYTLINKDSEYTFVLKNTHPVLKQAEQFLKED